MAEKFSHNPHAFLEIYNSNYTKNKKINTRHTNKKNEIDKMHLTREGKDGGGGGAKLKEKSD